MVVLSKYLANFRVSNNLVSWISTCCQHVGNGKSLHPVGMSGVLLLQQSRDVDKKYFVLTQNSTPEHNYFDIPHV